MPRLKPNYKSWKTTKVSIVRVGEAKNFANEFPSFKQAQKNKEALIKTLVEILEIRYLVALMKLKLTNARANVTIPPVILLNLKEPKNKSINPLVPKHKKK